VGNTYCLYKNKKYSYEYEEDMIKLISHEKEKDFENYVDMMGNVADNLFSKLVSPDELDLICSEEHEFKYKDKYFVSARSINKEMAEKNSVILLTLNENTAKKFNFKKIEQFVFEKEVSLNDITELLITRRPLPPFEDREIERIVIPQNRIKKYIKKYSYKKVHKVDRKYCIYNGKKYYFESAEKMVEIISNEYEEGFKNYLQITGEVSKDFFSRRVSIDELDKIYLEKYKVKYKDMYFGILVFKGNIIINNKVTLFTNDRKISKEFDFRKLGQFGFEKDISFDDIQELIITRQPLEGYENKFKNAETKKVIKSKGEIREHIKEYLKIEVPM